MNSDQIRTAQILAIGREAERQNMRQTVIPALLKVQQTGIMLGSTCRLIKEIAWMPKMDQPYRKKRLEMLAKELGATTIEWRNAFALIGESVDESPLRPMISELQDEITAYLKTGKLTKLRAVFRAFPDDKEFTALITTSNNSEWTPAREWMAVELDALKRSKKTKGYSYKVLSTLFLLPRLVDTKKELFVGERKLTDDDRQTALETIEYTGTTNDYFVNLVSKWRNRSKLREEHISL